MITTCAAESARRRRSISRGSYAFLGCLALSGACRTATPDELYGAPPKPGGGAGSSARGGSSGSSSGGKPAVGGASVTAGAAGDDGIDLGGNGSGGDRTQGPAVDDCGAPPAGEQAFTRLALREAAADCAIWQYCRAESAAQHLSQAIDEHHATATAATLLEAQQAWRAAMLRWSVAELFQFGPAGSKVESAGKDPVHGQGFRDFVYAWPVVGRCRVDEQVVGHGYDSSWVAVPISARGLFALEYLLFYPGADTACTPTSATGQKWLALDEASITSAKLVYAAAVADDVTVRLNALREAWSPQGGNFRQTLIDAQGYENEQQALNVIAWSLLYVEREVKDWKVGIPAGFALTHPVSVAEGSFSLSGIETLRENLKGFRALFQGCGENGQGLGFDDWLTDVGQGELASDMLVALDGAEAAAASFPGFEQATQAELVALYEALRALTTLLKADFFGPGSTLNLKLPAGVASDTD